ncbi:MAG: 2-succinyl-5-enolpyruvyl-6-hydroxy-3-cyclohexene-1-carboxylic-acid synthase [Anaerolinea sp.]|nr:2-succinyl-5-enolpyruvyl-6-hydroxy-3-cyclohexene-1-carboxylic-acid synthase [Anaerolinea sp.]
MDVGAANTAASRALVAGLAANGVRHACITPGSRSTPLTVAFAEQRAIRPWLHLDERSAAFFALGLARATGEPVALVCTSGTAAANWMPAVVEANLSRIPLILLTADRPPALRDRGAAQTMDQAGMYGRQVRWTLDLPLPSGSDEDRLRFLTFARRAVHASLAPLPGPVHLNVPFDEPLMAPPASHAAPEPVISGTLLTVAPPATSPELDAAARALEHCARPLIVAGPESGGLPASAIARLAARLEAPILADGLSGLRNGDHDRSHVLDSFDSIVRDGRAAALRPDAIIHFGGPPTSKALNGLLGQSRGIPYVLCDLPGGFRDANNAASHLVFGSAASIADALAGQLAGRTAEPGWAHRWRAANSRARDVLQTGARRFEELFEGRVFTELQRALPPDSTIVAGNSMPVRDLDSFITSDAKPLHMVSNRGANGIDGVVSSALGAAAVATAPVVLVIGDISFYHDMNGLWAAKRHALNLTVVLVNNNGGGIFHYLPQAAHPAVFEEWFGTPSGLDFRHAAALYNARYTLANDWGAFRDALNDGAGGGLNIIEVPTDRAANVTMHKRLWAEAAEAAFAKEEALA